MLRYQNLPSDFNPKFLILGESADFAALATLLREFAADGEGRNLAERIAPPPKGPDLVVSPAEGLYGLHPVGEGFVWSLNAYQAKVIASRLDVLAAADTINASDSFELGGEGEIPVAVSLGEFPEAYLDTRGP